LTAHYNERVFKAEASRVPLRRLASLEDVANAVDFILSDQAEFLTGITVPVSGGQVMP
jgi:3-oxoacyl-[acyl-carrier protein] reductase